MVGYGEGVGSRYTGLLESLGDIEPDSQVQLLLRFRTDILVEGEFSQSEKSFLLLREVAKETTPRSFAFWDAVEDEVVSTLKGSEQFGVTLTLGRFDPREGTIHLEVIILAITSYIAFKGVDQFAERLHEYIEEVLPHQIAKAIRKHFPSVYNHAGDIRAKAEHLALKTLKVLGIQNGTQKISIQENASPKNALPENPAQKPARKMLAGIAKIVIAFIVGAMVGGVAFDSLQGSLYKHLHEKVSKDLPKPSEMPLQLPTTKQLPDATR
jgi:hypothetical protein